MHAAAPDRKAYFPALTGVRAAAAYLVYLHHFNPFGEGGAAYAYAAEFHIGVTIFFVLSGFLITARYYGEARLSRGWLGGYIRNRVARIYPMYFLLTVLAFAAAYPDFRFLTKPHHAENFALNLTLLRGFFDDLKFTGIGQGWSLTVEECFYLSAPAIFLLARHRLLWLTPLLALAVGAALVETLGRLDYKGLFGGYRFLLNYTFFGRAFEFTAGAALALWLRRRNRDGSAAPIAPGAECALTYGGLAAVLAAPAWLALLRGEGSDHAASFTPGAIAVNNVALPLAIALFFAGLIGGRSWLARLLGSTAGEWLGRSSYVFYLIHLGPIRDFAARNLPGNDALRFAALVVISLLLYRLVEEPCNRLLRARRPR